MHPPIPPNCKHFLEDEEGVWYVDHDNLPLGTRERTLLDKLTPWDRYVAACVARCAWLDEAERLADKHGTYTNETEAFEAGVGTLRCECGVDTAMENAEAWKLCGEQPCTTPS